MEYKNGDHMKRVAIITIAGISSRFNEGIDEQNKKLKAIFSPDGAENTLLFHQIRKVSYADKIIIVGGYQFDELKRFCESELEAFSHKIVLIRNDHYEDLGSGFSLYLGIKEAVDENAQEVLFVEGDLDIDNESFQKIIDSQRSVLTYTREPIYANKAVVFYKNAEGHFRYLFNSNHGMLEIGELFSCLFNSGQTWKFTDMTALNKANNDFIENDRNMTNLEIIQRYIDNIGQEELELILLKEWTNCNTRDDYMNIRENWRKGI